MRQFLPGITLSIAFIAGCVASQLVRVVVPPARAGAAGTRWEYFCENKIEYPWMSEDRAKLNAVGREGWELVGVQGSNGDVFCFKRPIQ